MTFVVLYDACVLYPAPLRDLFVRLAAAGIVRAQWTEEILDERFENMLKNRPDLSREKLARTREMMERAIPDSRVTGYEGLIQGLVLPDLEDRHVLAAAIRAGAQAIVTFNLKDFPARTLASFGLEVKHPDDFLLDTLDLAAGRVYAVLLEQCADLKNPPRSLGDLLDTLSAQGLPQSVARVRELFGPEGP